MSEDLARVGRLVAARRVAAGFMSQREFAQAAGVALNTAAQLERGRTYPYRANRAKLEAALGWPAGSLDALLRGRSIAEVVVGTAPDASANVQALALAKGVASLAAVCRQILLDPRPVDAAGVLVELDAKVLELESVVAATLPYVGHSSFNQTVAALSDLRAIRAG